MGDQRRSRKEESGAVLADHLESHVHDRLPVAPGEAAEKLVQLFEKFRRFARAAPFDAAGGDAFGRGWDLGRLFPVVKQLIHRNFESPRHLFEGLDAWDGVAILHTRDVTTLQAGALLDITSREVFLLADGA